MNGPLVTVWTLGLPVELLLAMLVGAAFGFVLERAGFGRADRLTAIFYLRDFRVLRVMFTAVVTAMLGLYALDLLGWMPLGEVGLLSTYVWPQLAAGVLLGAGFIIGGYCPGTSLVAMASGKLDALLFVGGLFAGSIVFDVVYPDLEAFHQSGALGRLVLHEALGVGSGWVVLGVTLAAIGAFAAVSTLERSVRERAGLAPMEPEEFPRFPKSLFAGCAGVAAVALLLAGQASGHVVTTKSAPAIEKPADAKQAGPAKAPASRPKRALSGGCGG